jgi:hypothetical protein
MLMTVLEYGGMATGVIGAWLVAYSCPRRRLLGFGFFLVSNAFWVAWGAGTMTIGLLIMQAAYTVTSLRGIALSAHAARGAMPQAQGDRQ